MAKRVAKHGVRATRCTSAITQPLVMVVHPQPGPVPTAAMFTTEAPIANVRMVINMVRHGAKETIDTLVI